MPPMLIRFFTRIVLPFAIALLILYLTKPSDLTCKEQAIKKLATISITASGDDILIKDRVIAKSIRYIAKQDTLSFGFGALFGVRISDVKLKAILAHRNAKQE